MTGFARRFAGLVLALGVALCPRTGKTCAPAPRPDQSVHIADEEALIVWDAAKRTEHFVRRASFRTEGPAGAANDFGFLVPTPTQPTLGEADNAVFASLEGATRPEYRTVTKTEYELGISCLYLTMRGKSAAHAPQDEVRVLDQARVAGYDAVVLEADSSSGLNEWLGAHGYASRPALTAWLSPYVAAHWKVTAFKVAPASPNDPRVATSAVRMTFETDKPFFPYREPEDQRSGPPSARILDVFMVSTAGRLDGAIGEAHHNWPGATRYAKVREDVDTVLRGALPAGLTIGKAWLMSFRDTSSPRPGTDDLFFATATTQAEMIPPPITWTNVASRLIPVDLLALGIALVALVVRLAVRKKSGP
jgi:hypothetical protein